MCNLEVISSEIYQNTLEMDEQLQLDKAAVADYVNTFLIDIATNLINKLTTVKTIYSIGSNGFNMYYSNVTGKISFSKASADFLYKELKSLNSKKS